MNLRHWREPSVLDSFRDLWGSRDEWTFIPPADLVENQHEIVLTLDIPGIQRDKLDVSVDEGLLTVRGERQEERERKDSETYRVERVYGSFQRAFRLPSAVDAEQVKATYKDGVLEVRLPKTEAAKAKKIPVQPA